jgi:hypothetical protein
MTWRLTLACGLLLVAAGCSEPQFTMPIPTSATEVAPTPNPTPTPVPTPTVPSTSDTFERSLNPGERAFHAFTVGLYGRVDLALESLQGASVLTLGLGRPSGTDCAVTSVLSTSVEQDPFFSDVFQAGVYCLRVPDTGTVTAPVSFSIRIDHP